MLAHPFWDIEEPSEVQALIEDLDIDGVEVFYPDHDEAQTKFLVEPVPRARPGRHRLERLPRAEPQDVQHLGLL